MCLSSSYSVFLALRVTTDSSLVERHTHRYFTKLRFQNHTDRSDYTTRKYGPSTRLLFILVCLPHGWHCEYYRRKFSAHSLQIASIERVNFPWNHQTTWYIRAWKPSYWFYNIIFSQSKIKPCIFSRMFAKEDSSIVAIPHSSGCSISCWVVCLFGKPGFHAWYSAWLCCRSLRLLQN